MIWAADARMFLSEGKKTEAENQVQFRSIQKTLFIHQRAIRGEKVFKQTNPQIIQLNTQLSKINANDTTTITTINKKR